MAASAFTVGGALSDHLADTSDAHDASAISFSPGGTVAASDVQAAIAEVASEAAPAMKLLSDTTLGANGTFDIQSISQSYVDLRCILLARGARASGNDTLLLRLNNDSGGNYDLQTVGGGAATPFAGEAFAATSISLGAFIANTGGAGLFDAYEILIPGYSSTTWNKQVHSHGGVKLVASSAGLAIFHHYGYWRSTAAINQLTFFGSVTANLLAGSRLRIFGLS